jgi:hypothetical protein
MWAMLTVDFGHVIERMARPPASERMNSPLEIRKVRLRGL